MTVINSTLERRQAAQTAQPIHMAGKLVSLAVTELKQLLSFFYILKEINYSRIKLLKIEYKFSSVLIPMQCKIF